MPLEYFPRRPNYTVFSPSEYVRASVRYIYNRMTTHNFACTHLCTYTHTYLRVMTEGLPAHTWLSVAVFERIMKCVLFFFFVKMTTPWLRKSHTSSRVVANAVWMWKKETRRMLRILPSLEIDFVSYCSCGDSRLRVGTWTVPRLYSFIRTRRYISCCVCENYLLIDEDGAREREELVQCVLCVHSKRSSSNEIHESSLHKYHTVLYICTLTQKAWE